MRLLYLAWQSVLSRKLTTILTVMSIMISTALLLSVEKLRVGARAGFEQTISGTDLIVGARSGPINLLLYSVFRLGDPTANVSWDSYQRFASRSDVAWTVPMSLGDSVGKFRVLGTTKAYFDHYKYAGKRALSFAMGRRFDGIFEVVLGATAARELGYSMGDEFHISHGLGGVSFAEHKERSFQVVGILNATGTPVDSTVHITLEGLEAVHIGGNSAPRGFGGHRPAQPQALKPEMLQPKSITAFLVGMKSRVLALRYQRAVNEYRGEALSAVLPGVALAQLWRIVGAGEQALRVVALLVVAAGLLGMLTSVLTSLNERRREIAVLRAVGAGKADIFFLLVLESTLLAALGAVGGLVLVQVGVAMIGGMAEATLGIPLGDLGLSSIDLLVPAVVTLFGFLLGCVPATLAYRRALSDGLTVQT